MIKIFADGADLEKMRELVGGPQVAGFTTNPTLARKAGVLSYAAFGKAALEMAGTKPVSIEVIADDFDEMERQARLIASWGPNAVVKIPVMNTRGESSAQLIRTLAEDGIPLNVTAVLTLDQVREVVAALDQGRAPVVVSVFAGRVADTGRDPLTHMEACWHLLNEGCPRAELLWASPRQSYDVVLATRAGCDIITMTPELIAKTALFGRDLTQYSRETVEMFYRDAWTAGFDL